MKGDAMKADKNLRILACALPLLALASCAQNIQAGAVVEKGEGELASFLETARKGFAMKGDKIQKVVDLSGNALFQNTYSYDYQFDSGDHPKVKEIYSYPSGGQIVSETMNLSRSEDGYVSREYVNYKNEIGYSKLADDYGYYSFYDEYFTNPFAMVDASDFAIEAIEGGVSYSLASGKLNAFDYFLTGNAQPLSSIDLVHKGESWSIEMTSVVFTGRTKKDDNEYQRCQWTFVSDLALSNLGEVHLEGATPNKKRENVALRNALDSIKDNFTLTCTLSLASDPSTPIQTKVSYFDGEAYYIDLEASDDDKTQDYLYHKDPFSDSDLLYEYKYDSASRLWIQSSKDEESSYNVDPSTKSLFTPHLGDVSIDLFAEGMDKDDCFAMDNDSAAPYIGEGFFSDGEMLPYYTYGYGAGAKIKVLDEGIAVSLPFYMPVSSSYVLVNYDITYSHVGTTVLPEVDL